MVTLPGNGLLNENGDGPTEIEDADGGAGQLGVGLI